MYDVIVIDEAAFENEIIIRLYFVIVTVNSTAHTLSPITHRSYSLL